MMSVAHVVGHKKKILLVDDSRTSLFMESMTLDRKQDSLAKLAPLRHAHS